MGFFTKVVNLFTKTKTNIETLKEKLANFIELHKGNIKVLMNIFQAIYSKGNGHTKMQNVVQTVCTAAGADEIGKEYSEEIVAFVEEKCQKIYDELVADGDLKK